MMKKIFIVFVLLSSALLFGDTVFTADSKDSVQIGASADISTVLDLSSFCVIEIGFYSSGAGGDPLNEIPLSLGSRDDNGNPTASAEAFIGYEIHYGKPVKLSIKADNDVDSEIEWNATVDNQHTSGNSQKENSKYTSVEFFRSEESQHHYAFGTIPLHIETEDLSNAGGEVLEAVLSVIIEEVE